MVGSANTRILIPERNMWGDGLETHSAIVSGNWAKEKQES
jgi:hypothetical protein